MINVKMLAETLDSKTKIYDEVFVATRDVVSEINEICTEASLTLANTYPNIEVTVEPFGIIVSINPQDVKRISIKNPVYDIKHVLIKAIADKMNI